MPNTQQGQFDLNTFIPACTVPCTHAGPLRNRGFAVARPVPCVHKADHLILFRNRGATQAIQKIQAGMKKMNTPASYTAATSASLGGIDSTRLSHFCFDFVYGFQLSFFFFLKHISPLFTDLQQKSFLLKLLSDCQHA